MFKLVKFFSLRRRLLGGNDESKPDLGMLKLSGFDNVYGAKIITLALKDDNARERLYAAEQLGGLNNSWAVKRVAIPALEELKNDPEVEVRRQAVRSIRRLGGKKAHEFMFRALNDPDPAVRGEAADLLGTFEDMRVFKRAIPELERLLNDPDHNVRVSAAFSLGWRHTEESYEPLIRALKNSDPGVRMGAVTGLGKLANKRVAPALESLLEDPDDSVFDAVVQAISEWGNAEALTILVKALRLKGRENHAVERALGRFGGNAQELTPVWTLMRSTDPEERLAAVYMMRCAQRTVQFDEFHEFFDDMVANVRQVAPNVDAYELVKAHTKLTCPYCGGLTDAAIESIYIVGSTKVAGSGEIVGLGPNISSTIQGKCPKCGGTSLWAMFQPPDEMVG